MSASFLRSSMVAYGVLLLLSVSIALWQGRLGAIFEFPGWNRFWIHLAMGVGLAILVLTAARLLKRAFRWARLLEAEFRAILAPMGVTDAVLLAGASGFVEELFFRAVLQPELGLWPTSIAFGLLHYPMNRRMVPWTVLATLLGVLFGTVYIGTGSLLAVALAHGLINFVELMEIGWRGRGEGSRLTPMPG